MVREIKDNILKFSVDNFSMDDYNSDEFAIARLCVLSTRPNSHELVISDEVLKKYAPTVLGKWLVAEYDNIVKDVTTHTAEEWIMGYFPLGQEVEFVESDDGYICAYANAIVSKIYATELCELFDEDTVKPVSVEMQYSDDDGDNVVQEFNIVGVTVLGQVLGREIKGSCPDANMQMVRFSQDDANKFYEEHMSNAISEPTDTLEQKKEEEADMSKEIEFAAVDLGEMYTKVSKAIEDKVGYRFYITGLYEEDGQKFAIVKASESGDVVKFDYSYTEDGVELGEPIGVDIEFVPNDKTVKFAVPEGFEQYTEPEDEDIDDNDPEDEPNEPNEPGEANDDDDDDKKADMAAKIEELTAMLEEKENIIMEQGKELEDLRQFKADREALEKQEKVDAVIGVAKEYLEEEEVQTLMKEAECCEIEHLTEWENRVKAACFAVVQATKMSDNTFRIDIPAQANNESESVWDRLK